MSNFEVLNVRAKLLDGFRGYGEIARVKGADDFVEHEQKAYP
jgi:hypothetical protein